MIRLPPDHHGLFLTRDLAQIAEDERTLSREADRGTLQRVRHGAYVDARAWEQADARTRHTFLMRALDLAARSPHLFSHRSAAAVWGLPLLNSQSSDAHALTAKSNGGRSGVSIVRHGVDLRRVSIAERDGFAVTSLERTVLDLALTEPFASAVMATDLALWSDLGRVAPLTTLDALRDELELIDPARGRARIEFVLDFADGDSGSPNESLSRARFHELGFPAPVLQKRFVHHTGIADRADFFWEEFGHIGESDGQGKYLDPRLTKGLDPAEIVMREKARENRLRSQQPRFSRWEWMDALIPSRLAAILIADGLPRAQHRRR